MIPPRKKNHRPEMLRENLLALNLKVFFLVFFVSASFDSLERNKFVALGRGNFVVFIEIEE